MTNLMGQEIGWQKEGKVVNARKGGNSLKQSVLVPIWYGSHRLSTLLLEVW